MDYFDYATGLRMTKKSSARFLAGSPGTESALTQDDMDIAASVQVVTEEIVSKLPKQFI
ncbi:MAG: hypothetical protein CM1200mP18_21410 [Gammaproteobacteria bacterium]|nr:MAG: hypothetical protein CM1200mP18_21410 [Gammaproteobacteria bacterium]